MTATELVIAASLSMLCLGVAIPQMRFSQNAWHRADAEVHAKQVLAEVEGRLAPSIRNSLRIDEAQSTPTSVTLVMPLKTASGSYALPLTGGDRISYYLSDTSGAPTAVGTILWRAVNGTPDTAWSLRNGRGAVNLGTAGLTFTYTPTTNVQSVRLSVSTSKTSGTIATARSATTEVFLRNWQPATSATP